MSTDAVSTFPLNPVINGDPTVVQTLGSTTTSYHGTTTLFNSTLSIPALANGGSTSSIGASSNAAGNLMFGSGPSAAAARSLTGGPPPFARDALAPAKRVAILPTVNAEIGPAVG